MSLELMDGFTDTKKSAEELKEEIAEKDKKRREDLKKFQPIAELIKGKEKAWEGTKSIIKDWVYTNLMVGHEVVSRDFLAGIKFAIEIIDERYKTFETSFNELGKE